MLELRRADVRVRLRGVDARVPEVALLILGCRRISAIGTPASSPCFRAIWLSVKRDFRMGISLG
jgi:hypothetical protein